MTPSQSAEPTQYEGLIEYYNRHKYQERQVESDPIYMSWLHDKSLLYAAEHSVNFNLAHNIVSVNHDLMEASDLPEFVKLFGPDIFVLWKAALLRKRIMFIDVPPMETSCRYGKNANVIKRALIMYPSLFHALDGTYSGQV